MTSEQRRIVELQHSLKICKTAFELIVNSSRHDPRKVAETALDEVWRRGPKQPIIVGHGGKR